MIRNIIYGVCASGSLAMLLVAAPSGALLTGKPTTGKVTTDTSGNSSSSSGRRTIRGGPAFIWLGGGYQGGK
ncbi:MAG: hypothetical protein KUG77_06900 [Nannocystaceae bacterium]|nr:hypothetical protein [Nannocystaceae bacterium]